MGPAHGKSWGRASLAMSEISPGAKRKGGTRDVLMIVYRFAPVAGSFVQRIVKLVKYLDREGWRSTIVTPRWTGEVLDHDLAETVPASVVVLETGEAKRGPADMWRLLERTPGGWRWVRALRRNLVYPDYAHVWKRAAVDRARRALSERHFDVLYSASPPATAHLAAMRLRSEFRIPWLLDFHDPWVDNEQQYERMWGIRKMLDRRLEAKVLGEADIVAANTRFQQESFIQSNNLPPEKVVWTPCGYDEEDFSLANPPLPSERIFRIAYTGSFYRSYNPSFFFECLSGFLEKQGARDLRMTLAGKSCDATDLFDRFPTVKDRLDLKGYLRHEEIPGLLRDSHLLFLMIAPGGRQVPAKFYEYLRAGRPIIATGDTEGDVAEILRETGRGRFFLPGQGDGLVSYLTEIYERWRTNGSSPPFPPDASIQRFEMQAVARTFVAAFERAIELMQMRGQVVGR